MDISAAIDEVAKMLIQKVSESKNVSLGFIFWFPVTCLSYRLRDYNWRFQWTLH